jgi:hypothetical protein
VIEQIPIDSIVIGEKRKKRFDPKNEKNRLFVDSIERAGMLNPVNVRPIRDKDGNVIEGKYELVCGRRRLWAAKTLGHQYVMAKLGEWIDDEINFLSLAENIHRQHLEGAAWLKAMADLQKEKERIWGKNPGRRLSGIAGAAAVQRDPVTKKFAKKAVEATPENDVSPDSETAEPLSADRAHSGSGKKRKAAKSHASLIEEETGMSLRLAQKDLKTASAFTEEQLVALAAIDASKADCEKLTTIEDPERRSIAISLMLTGVSADGAIAEATKDSPEMEQLVASRTEETIPDQEWVESYCKSKRERFQDPKMFDRDAILYRRTREQRAVFKAKAGKEILAAHDSRPTMLTRALAKILFLAHPRDWYVCSKCYGLNIEEPECDKCNGTGFEINIEWPHRTKKS